MIEKQNGIVPMSVTYGAISNGTLANRVAARELKQATSMLASMKIKGNRKFASLRPNDVIKVTWPILGLSEFIVRVMRIDYGTLEKG